MPWGGKMAVRSYAPKRPQLLGILEPPGTGETVRLFSRHLSRQSRPLAFWHVPAWLALPQTRASARRRSSFPAAPETWRSPRYVCFPRPQRLPRPGPRLKLSEAGRFALGRGRSHFQLANTSLKGPLDIVVIMSSHAGEDLLTGMGVGERRSARLTLRAGCLEARQLITGARPAGPGWLPALGQRSGRHRQHPLRRAAGGAICRGQGPRIASFRDRAGRR